jgi:hypothetical protein
MAMTEIDALLELVKALPEGLIDRETALGKQVIGGLKNAWPMLQGSDDQSTFANKLGRAENLELAPPLITFRIRRHGGTVNGSSREELHFWEVDLERRVARIARQTHQQLEKMAKKLDCEALARDIVAVIESGKNHDGFNWEDGKQTVTMNIGKLIPEAVQKTTSDRRKRFRTAFLPLMAALGWEFRPKGNVMRFSRAEGGT